MTFRIVIRMDTQELIELGAELVAGGFGGHELTIRRMVRDARSAGIGGAAADVLADTTAPDVARFRAFAVVSAALSRVEWSPDLVRPVA
jgi:hypothetical protein